MIERGWEIEREVDPLRHETGHSKAVYAEMQDAARALRQRHQDFDNDISKRRGELAEMRESLDDDMHRVNLARKQVETERKTSREEGRREGYAEGLQEGRAQGIAEAERLQQLARERLALADEHYDAALTSHSIPDEQTRYLATLGARHLATVLGKHVDDATQRKVEQVKTAVERSFARSPEVLITQAREAARVLGNKLVGESRASHGG